MVVFHLSTFILHLHLTRGFLLQKALLQNDRLQQSLYLLLAFVFNAGKQSVFLSFANVAAFHTIGELITCHCLIL